MTGLTWGILAALAAVGLLNLLAVLLLWVHLDRRGNQMQVLSQRLHEVDVRMGRIETAAIGGPELRALYERMAGIEGKLSTQTDLMKTIQEHLLERDE